LHTHDLEEEIFTKRHRVKEDRPDTFAEQQAKFAKEAANELEYLGMDLVQVLQSVWLFLLRRAPKLKKPS
jgi:hypothetical protein